MVKVLPRALLHAPHGNVYHAPNKMAFRPRCCTCHEKFTLPNAVHGSRQKSRQRSLNLFFVSTAAVDLRIQAVQDTNLLVHTHPNCLTSSNQRYHSLVDHRDWRCLIEHYERTWLRTSEMPLQRLHFQYVTKIHHFLGRPWSWFSPSRVPEKPTRSSVLCELVTA